MNDPFLNIHCYARAQMVEQVMALHGRASSNPARYRRLLEAMGLPALQRALEENDFPALSLTENAGEIASADTGTVPGPERETLTVQSYLP